MARGVPFQAFIHFKNMVSDNLMIILRSEFLQYFHLVMINLHAINICTQGIIMPLILSIVS